MSVKSIKSHKEKRQAKVILEDLNDIEKVLDLTIRGLSVFKKYTLVMEIISCAQTNKTLVEIQKKKYEKMMENS